MKVIFDNVLIKPDKPEAVTESGIVLPDREEKTNRGTVISVGEKVTQVKKKDKVIFKKWEGNEIKLKGEDLLIVKEENILATIK